MAKGAYGYGTVRFRGKTVGAHRAAWNVIHGEIPEGMCVLHRCDNPPCCNAESHLFLGTAYDNIADRDAKGRHRPMLGTENGAAKLDDTGVRLVRELWHYGFSQDAIGKLFGIPQGYISRVATKKAWKHVS